MFIPEGDIRFACTTFGAKLVFGAACRRMAGDHRALPALGLPDAETSDEADRIGQVCFGIMTPAERDDVITAAAIVLGRLPDRRRSPRPSQGAWLPFPWCVETADQAL